MGESASQTVREIEEVRERLDGEIRELEERLPPARVAKRVAGGLAVGSTGTAVWWVVRRARKRRERKKKAERPAVQAVVQLIPDRWSRQIERAVADGSWQRPAAYAAGVWAVFKIAEVRQLRKMNRLLASRG